MRKKSFTRDERKAMIITWFAHRIQNGNESFATMNEIARGLGMSPSTHLTMILRQLVAADKLVWREVTKPGRWTGREFMLFPGTYERPRGRAIPVKAHGLVAGQLELIS